METLEENLIPLVISNIVALLILLAAIKRTKLARLLFVLLFGWACWINYTTSHKTPDVYLDYAALTPFDLYRDFITGFFKKHITVMVTFISFGQGAIALGFLLRGIWVRLACFGAMAFLLAITPLGIGSGFPFTLITLSAVYHILKRDDMGYLWKSK